MRLWQYLLAEDKRIDLSTPEAAAAWLCSQPWGLRAETASAPTHWTRDLLALRSLARRLRGRRPRRRAPAAPEDDAAADRIAFHYLGLMHTCVVLSPPGGVLSAATFRGVSLLPTYALDDALSLGPSGECVIQRVAFEWQPRPSGEDVEGQLNFWREDGAVFWQIVFHSLLTDSGLAICQTCGAALGNETPTGRPKKQRQCGPCRWQAWRRRQPPQAMRQRWRDDEKKRKTQAVP
jgi:hypothetical protein